MFNLLCGDAIEKMKELKDDSIDMIFCDPPYGITSCKWDATIPFEPMWQQIKRIMKENGVAVFTSSQPFSSALVMSNPSMFKHEWIWIKNRGSNFANTVREPMKEHETVLVFANKKWTYNKQMQNRTGSGENRIKYDFNTVTESENYRKFERASESKGKIKRVPSSWQKFNTASGKEKTNHPTQKPVDLAKYFIKTYSNENDTILDFAMGSGTFGVAATLLNRKFIGIDNDIEWVKLSYNRIMHAKEEDCLNCDQTNLFERLMA